MQKDIVIYHYSNEKGEAIKAAHRKKIFDYSHTQGAHDGQRQQPITMDEFKTLELDVLQTETQLAMEDIKKELTVAGLLFDAKEAEAIAEKRQTEIRKESNSLAHQKNELLREKAALEKQCVNNRLAKWLLPIAILFGVIDTAVAYENFKVAFEVIQALIMAAGVGTAVFASHLFAQWPLKAKTKKIRKSRITIVLSVALLFFVVFAAVRAQSMQAFVNTSLAEGVEETANPYLSALSFLCISFLLFITSFFLSLFYSKTPAEKELDAQHSALDCRISETDRKLALLQKELKELPQKIAAQKSDARHVYYYLVRSIEECKAASSAALAEYKKTYAQYSDQIPAFFHTHPPLSYDESVISNLKNNYV